MPNFGALTEDRWLGGDAFKTQVNNKGCPTPPPPPPPPTPARSLAFVNTDLKREGLVVAFGGGKVGVTDNLLAGWLVYS